jgi:mannose-6-phosphate isomerase-like protein (cupin superfamily)
MRKAAAMWEFERRPGLVLEPGEGRVLNLFGLKVTFKSISTDSRGVWSLVEYSAPPHFAGTPTHWHKENDEAFYVVEGMPTFHLDGQDMHTQPGSYVFIPRGVLHSFSNEADTPARILTLLAPAGFEQYWLELAELVKDEPFWPPPDRYKVTALAEKYDLYTPDDK